MLVQILPSDHLGLEVLVLSAQLHLLWLVCSRCRRCVMLVVRHTSPRFTQPHPTARAFRGQVPERKFLQTIGEVPAETCLQGREVAEALRDLQQLRFAAERELQRHRSLN